MVPARYPLTVLHRPAADGMQTLCGMPFEEAELWLPAERRDSDVICWVCEAEYRGCVALQSAREVQGTLL